MRSTILLLYLYSISCLVVRVAALEPALASQAQTQAQAVQSERLEKHNDSLVISDSEYGVDVSFPMHYPNVSTNYLWLPHNQPSLNSLLDATTTSTPVEYQNMPLQPLGDRRAFHQRYLQGCRDKYPAKNNTNDNSSKRRPSPSLCDLYDEQRLQMARTQPPGMRNYTQQGFVKLRAPPEVFRLLQDFWLRNRDTGMRLEQWGKGDIYTNHWEAPAQFLSLEDPALEGGGRALKDRVWNAARHVLQQWTGQRLVECSLYGIRVYPRGAVLAPHVDRLPLVSSAILNVDQDVQEPWPLEVIGHDGQAHNITMEPGDLVLYESHSILHGRPFALQGRFMANVFIHFEPVGPLGGPLEYTGDLPPYIVPKSQAEFAWRKVHPRGHQLQETIQRAEAGSVEAHHAAQTGDLDKLRLVLDQYPEQVHARDRNGWTPLHEAVRFGQLDAAEFLLARGANVNARTGSQSDGGSPLDTAHEYYGDELMLLEELTTLLNKYKAKLHEPATATNARTIKVTSTNEEL